MSAPRKPKATVTVVLTQREADEVLRALKTVPGSYGLDSDCSCSTHCAVRTLREAGANDEKLRRARVATRRPR